MRPDAAFKASMITLDSACLKEEGKLTATTASEDAESVAIGTSNSLPRVTMTARSMKFANSRMLPFHGQFVSRFIACRDIDLIWFRIRAENLETKKIYQQRNILAPLPQRRNLDRENVEPVKKVLAEFLILNHRSQIAVRRGNYPDIYVDRRGTSQALELLLLNGA
jgi:hypothetical protein